MSEDAEQDEDVEIRVSPQAEESIEISIDALKSDGYEPPVENA